MATAKIHISCEFSFIEFDCEFDPNTLEGLPGNDRLFEIWERLPRKSKIDLIIGREQEALKSNALHAERLENKAEARVKKYNAQNPPATANQRRVLERYGEWKDGMTKAEANRILTELGF